LPCWPIVSFSSDFLSLRWQPVSDRGRTSQPDVETETEERENEKEKKKKKKKKEKEKEKEKEEEEEDTTCQVFEKSYINPNF